MEEEKIPRENPRAYSKPPGSSGIGSILPLVITIPIVSSRCGYPRLYRRLAMDYRRFRSYFRRAGSGLIDTYQSPADTTILDMTFDNPTEEWWITVKRVDQGWDDPGASFPCR